MPLQKNIVKLDKISDSEIETTKNITLDQLVTQLQNERVVVENNLIKCIIPAYDLGTNEYIFDTVSEQLREKINLILPYVSKIKNKSDRFVIVEKKMSDAITGEVTTMKFILDKYTDTRSAFMEEHISDAFLEKYTTILDLIAIYGNVVINNKPC